MRAPRLWTRLMKRFHIQWTRCRAALLYRLMLLFNLSCGRGKGVEFSLIAALLFGLQAAAQTGPPLAIQPSGTNQVQVEWPGGTNFNVLQEILRFSATNDWQDVPDAPSIFGAHYAVLREATNGAAFYRLAQRGVAGISTPPDPATTASVLADRKSTRLNSSHLGISYAVFCLKKK